MIHLELSLISGKSVFQFIFGETKITVELDLPFYFAHIMIPEIIYTMVVTIIIYMPVRRLVNRIYVSRREIQ